MVSSFLVPIMKEKPMNENEVIENKCTNCDKQCNKGIIQRIDGTYHCADED